MRAKSLNIDSSVYSHFDLPSGKRALVRLEYREGEGFDIAEAYLRVEQEVPTGSIAENYSVFKEIIDEWYNTTIRATNGFSFYDDVEPDASIIADGWAPLIGNWRYTAEFTDICNQVEKLETHRARRARVKSAASA